MELTNNEIVDILGIRYIGTSTTGYTPPPGKFEFSDFNLELKPSFLH